MKIIEHIDHIGGAIEAIDSGFIANEITRSAYEYQKEIEHQKSKPIQETPKKPTNIKPKKKTGSKSIISRLKDLDSEHS